MDFNSILKKKNLKVTKHRLEVLEVINALDENATMKNIIDRTDIDKSTVYRMIDTFTQNGIIEKNINDKVIYYSIKDGHKHYIKCIKCHRKDLILACPIDDIDTKYKIINHKLEIEGICNDCIKKLK